MTGYNTGGQNISGQFGEPLFGVGGLLPFTGNYFWVDATNGNDAATGGPQDPLLTVTAAYAKCTAGNNDVVLLVGGGSFSLTSTLTWAKNSTHLIGLGPSLSRSSTLTVASTAATTGAFTPLVNVTASTCYFSNLTAVSGINQAATQVCWAEAGGANTYSNVIFSQVGNATAGAQAGCRALTIASNGNAFDHCVIGSALTVRATGANATLEFLATAGNTRFTNCIFAMWSSLAGNTHVSAGASTMAGYTTFQNCSFVNNLQGASATSLTAAFALNASAGGVALLIGTTASVGATKISAAGPVYVAGSVPTAATSNLAVAAA